jgi:tetratricopeptide (TPR) repeat protein
MIICLTMIVGNEIETIERCLHSVKPWIQRYFILDKGSTDGSVEIVKRALQGIEGSIQQASSGADNKELLSLAKEQGDYLLLIAPDEQLTVTDRLGFGELDKDCYYAVSRQNGIDWRKPFLLRSALDWIGGELLTQDLGSPQAKSGKLLFGSILWNLKNRAHEDKERLKTSLALYPDNTRLLFHTARVCEDAGDDAEALELFEKRAVLEGDQQEVFYSLYRLAALREKQGDPLERVIDHYLKAYHFSPSRAEPLYDLSDRMIREENYVLGYVLSEFALTVPFPEDPFLRKSWIYEYGLLSQFAQCAFQIKKYKESKDTMEKLMKVPTLPPEQRAVIETNYAALMTQGALA